MRRDEIEDEARGLSDAVRRLGRRHPTAAIPRALRLQILAFVVRAKAGRWGVVRVARAVGVSVGSIANWRRDAGRAALLPVTVGPRRDAEASGLRVVGPSGYRVEGLDVATTVALLRALE